MKIPLRRACGELESAGEHCYHLPVPNRFRIVTWVILLVAAGLFASRFLREPDIAVAEETYRFNLAQEEAVKTGNHVVYSRHTVSNSGLPTRDAARHPWKSLLSGATNGAPLQVVYVHGYNTTFAESIAQGNYLSRLLRQWTAQKYPATALDFHTFSWRADFGPDKFPTAELAAKAQSASLGAFLKTLRQPASAGGPPPKIILITHSLGARLVLETLSHQGHDADFPVISALLLVEPAMLRTSLSRGTYETFKGDNIMSVRYDGEFFTALDSVPFALATCSSTDDALTQIFNPTPEATEGPATPKLNAPLGLPYYSATEAEVFPDNFRLIDLSPGRYIDMALPSHDSLFNASGRRALWTLWSRLLRQTLTPGAPTPKVEEKEKPPA